MTVRLLLIGDVGDDAFHVGDEAMFETALDALARRGDAHVTAITSGPEVVRSRYGVAATGHLGFDPRRGAAHDEVRDVRLRAVLTRAADEPAVAAWWDAVDQADAVLVTGGGNLCSSWPHLVYERIALLSAASERGIPVVLVGQSVGPHLTARQAELLAPLLSSAHLVGVRDVASETFVRNLCPEATMLLHVDDAVALPSGTAWSGAPDAYVAMAFHPVDQPSTDALRDTIGAFIRTANDATGHEVLLLPNTGTLGGDTHDPGTDAALMNGWSAAFGPDVGVRVAPMLSSRDFAATVRGSSAVVSTRFHPIVFALSGSVPAIGLTTDRYTTNKLTGALAHAGLDGWRLPFASMGTASPELLLTELVRRRDDLRDHLATATATWSDRHEQRWDLVWRCLEGHRPSPEQLDRPAPAPRLDPTMPTGVLHQLADGWYDREDRLVRAAEVAEAGETRNGWLTAPLRRGPFGIENPSRELAIAHDRLAAALDALEREQQSADTARQAAAQARHELATFEPITIEVDQQYVASLERELAAMRSTRLFRWTRPVRWCYARVRSLIRTSGSRRRS